jgi:hypothetical protein
MLASCYVAEMNDEGGVVEMLEGALMMEGLLSGDNVPLSNELMMSFSRVKGRFCSFVARAIFQHFF